MDALLIVFFVAGLAVWGGRRLSKAAEAEWGSRALNLLDGLNRLFCRHYHRLEGGPIPLPETGPALVVSNHLSGLDALLLIATARRPLRFLIAREQYRRFGLQWLFRAVGCIPVDRDSRPEQAFRAALRTLAMGEVVALFPHGGIHLDRDGHRPLKPGAARLAQLAGVPIYPVRIEGIRGEGVIVRSVLLRSHARILTHGPVDCSGLKTRDCLARIAPIIEGRALEPGEESQLECGENDPI